MLYTAPDPVRPYSRKNRVLLDESMDKNHSLGSAQTRRAL